MPPQDAIEKYQTAQLARSRLTIALGDMSLAMADKSHTPGTVAFVTPSSRDELVFVRETENASSRKKKM